MARKEDIVERLKVLAEKAAQEFWKKRKTFSIEFEGKIFTFNPAEALLITIAARQPVRDLGWGFIGLFPDELVSIVENGFRNQKSSLSEVLKIKELIA